MTGAARPDFAKAARVLVLSLSNIPADGRILRQIGSLQRAGKVIEAFGATKVVGSTGPDARGDGFSYHGFPVQNWDLKRRFLASTAFLAARVLPGESLALALARVYPGASMLRMSALAWAEQQPSLADCAVIAHDWASLPAAIALNQQFGLPFHYDSHEYATEEHAHNGLWRLIFPHLIRRIERAGLNRAHSSSCPGKGIRDAMNAVYEPAHPVQIIRNAPDGIAMVPKATGERIELLYHGLFKPDRGLVELVTSVNQWPSRYHLVLRGHAPNPVFGRVLEAAIAASSGRVTITPMVPAQDVTREAHKSDIGVFLPDIRSMQNRFAAPNKLFEYLQAGLMTIVPKGSEMGETISASGAGIAIDNAAMLPEILTNLDRQQVDLFRACAHALALKSNWRSEEPHFLEVLGMAQVDDEV